MASANGVALTEREAIEGEAADSVCLINGMVAGVSGGVLGGVIGLGSSVLRNRGRGMMKRALKEAAGSAKTFGVLGGWYSTCQCFAKKMRGGKDDAINSAIAGCASGIAIAYKGGPAQAAQSCAGLGLISYIIDATSPPPAYAADYPQPPLGIVCDGGRKVRRPPRSQAWRWGLVLVCGHGESHAMNGCR
mmetsp:Transcript_45520/g.144804  ORF Transcript_45520/g.144804 Transcript_45520/m.144804 type:complete len:190 (-) Transcript_45520:60-629(-)